MTSRLVILFAFLWYALVPAIGRMHASEGPSLRAYRHVASHAIVAGGTSTREGARPPRGQAPALAAEDATPLVADVAFVRSDAPSPEHVAAPDALPFVPVARGPPAG